MNKEFIEKFFHSFSLLLFSSENEGKCLNSTYKVQAEFDLLAAAYLSMLITECKTLAALAWADVIRHILR